MIDKKFIHHPWGTIITGIVILGIVFLIFLSFTGEPDYLINQYDEIGPRIIYP